MTVWDVAVVFQAPSALGAEEWTSNWAIDTDPGLSGSQVAAIGAAFSNFHLEYLNGHFLLDRVVISTATPDSKPYNPETFATYPVGLPGNQAPVDTLLPLTNVVDVRKLCLNGRNGHLFLRGFLQESSISSEGGVPRLLNPAAITETLITNYAALTSALSSIGTVVVKTEINGVVTGREVASIGAPVLTTSSHHRPRKPKIGRNSPFRKIGEIVEAAHLAADAINPILEAFNALPVPDVPLLP